MLQHMEQYIEEISRGKHDIYITVDFNLPSIQWDTKDIDSSLGNRESATLLLEFMSKNFLIQVVDKPTRGRNVIDLILTNRPLYIAEIESEKTSLSDHNLVTALMCFDERNLNPEIHVNTEPEASFRSLDIQKADIDAINEKLFGINLQELLAHCPVDEDGSSLAELMCLTVLQVCYELCPAKEPHGTERKPKINRARKIMYRKKHKIKSRIRILSTRSPNSNKIPKMQQEVNLLAYDIQQDIKNEKSNREQRAVQCVKSNPKSVYSYAKRFSKLKSNVGPLREQSTAVLHSSPAKMGDLLQGQYKTAFSNPENPKKKNTTAHLQSTSSKMATITFTIHDIIEAINEIDINASTSEGEIPARILKGCKHALAPTLMIIWKNSFEKGKIPAVYKKQYITPIYKGGPKTDPANYRPVSLTSHVIKIFERIIRKKLVNYLEENNLFSHLQHGFRKGRSCLTQLLQHFDFILKNYLHNTETDVIYLDYAKAFDKVDHDLLMAKLTHYGISGELFRWLQEFLTNREQQVVINRVKSEPIPVMSGVPQGTVLGRYYS